jgi:hypothetical protein
VVLLSSVVVGWRVPQGTLCDTVRRAGSLSHSSEDTDTVPGPITLDFADVT